MFLRGSEPFQVISEPFLSQKLRGLAEAGAACIWKKRGLPPQNAAPLFRNTHAPSLDIHRVFQTLLSGAPLHPAGLPLFRGKLLGRGHGQRGGAGTLEDSRSMAEADKESTCSLKVAQKG